MTDKSAKFGIGAIVKHRLYPFRGVVVDVDPESPVCAPTRSSLMTGRYSLRTCVRDTYNGGAIMSTDEITIAELLQEKGYKTGIFGKWHLGDNYPSRPSDQGFDESVIHLSGGIGQVGDITNYYQKDKSYFDPILNKNLWPQHWSISSIPSTTCRSFAL